MSISEHFLLAALREKMRIQGLNYSQLSERCNVPVSSLKRQLHNPSLGIDKINLYASHLNSDLYELVILAKELQHTNAGMISDKNNVIFTKYPYLYDFLYKLNSLGWTLEQIQAQHSLSDASVSFYLRALEMMGYLTIIEGKKYKLKSQSRFITLENSPLDRLFAERFKQYQDSHSIRPSVCVARIRLTDEQKTRLEYNLYDQIIAFNSQNQENKNAELRNILLSFVPGKAIELSDGLEEVDGQLLKEISKML